MDEPEQVSAIPLAGTTTIGKSKRLALVIGAGAVKCAAALGVWQVLDEAGIPIQLYIGCSGGSLYAASLALGFSQEETVERTLRLWNRQITRRPDWRSFLRALLPNLLGFDERFATIDDGPLLAALDTVFGRSTFMDTRTPLRILAADFHTAEQFVFKDGLIRDAIRASIAIPYIWKAWPVGNRLFVDGSVVNPMPVDVAIQEGADIILTLGFESAYPRRVKSLSRYAFHMNSLMTNNLFRANFAFHNLAYHAEILTILPDFASEVGLFETNRFPEIIAAGERAMRDQIPYLQSLLNQ